MSWGKLVKQITDDAIMSAANYKVNESSIDYKAGYVRGVRSLASLIEVSQLIATRMAKDEADTPMHPILMGYAASLQILLEAADSIIPPEYEMEP